jgi:glycosyltransferase involved in cell wall biosynthesis
MKEQADTVEGRERQVLPWNIVHACERVRDVLDVAECQLIVGMRPFLLTPQESGSAAIYLHRQDVGQGEVETSDPDSLLTAWGHVRGWRKPLSHIEVDGEHNLLHVHSFASGMASVRSSLSIIYDMRAFVEQLAVANAHCEEKPWLARSFRLAEQFIFARASAMVVHSPFLKAVCIERGATAESVFCICDPVLTLPEITLSDNSGKFVIFAPDVACSDRDAESSMEQALQLLLALQLVRRERKDMRLVLAPHQSLLPQIRECIEQFGIADCTTLLLAGDQPERAQWMRAASVVIAGPHSYDLTHFVETYSNALPSTTCLQALSSGRTVLAADSPQNRNVSPDGRGLLWYSGDSPRELANRLLYLAQHRDFCRALGSSARDYIAHTRSAAVIGHEYDTVYRYASQRRRDRPSQITGRLPLAPALGES